MKTLTQFIKESIGERNVGDANKYYYLKRDSDFGYESMIEAYCNDNGIEIPEEDSIEWWNLVDDLKNQEIDAFWENLAYSKYNDRYCILTGSLGLWHGNREVVPQFYTSLEDAIGDCTGRSIEDIEVYIKNGYVYVDAFHHNGVNSYQIRVIKDDPDSRIKFEDYRELCEDGEDDEAIDSFDLDAITDYVKELF